MISDQPPSSHPRAVVALARFAGTGRRAVLPTLVCLCGWFALGAASAQARPFIDGFMPNPPPIATTVPANGDVNPYGIVIVPGASGRWCAGPADQQLQQHRQPAGHRDDDRRDLARPTCRPGAQHLFATIDPTTLPGPCPGGVGLTTALAVTRTGYVIVGSLPTSDGTSATAQAGCLLVLNSPGQVVETIAGGPIDGPWDMTAVTMALTTLFVTNVLNGTSAATSPGPQARHRRAHRLLSFRACGPSCSTRTSSPPDSRSGPTRPRS